MMRVKQVGLKYSGGLISIINLQQCFGSSHEVLTECCYLVICSY